MTALPGLLGEFRLKVSGVLAETMPPGVAADASHRILPLVVAYTAAAERAAEAKGYADGYAAGVDDTQGAVA